MTLERTDTSDVTTIKVNANANGLAVGSHTADIVLQGEELVNSPLTVPVVLHVE